MSKKVSLRTRRPASASEKKRKKRLKRRGDRKAVHVLAQLRVWERLRSKVYRLSKLTDPLKRQDGWTTDPRR